MYILLQLLRSSSRGPGGIQITTTVELNAPSSFEPIIDLESNQVMNAETSQSFSRYVPTQSLLPTIKDARAVVFHYFLKLRTFIPLRFRKFILVLCFLKEFNSNKHYNCWVSDT